MRQAVGIFNYFDICPLFSTLKPCLWLCQQPPPVTFPITEPGFILWNRESRCLNILVMVVLESLIVSYFSYTKRGETWLLQLYINLTTSLSFLCSSETSAASGHSDCPTVISVDSNQSWSGIHSSTGTGISTERSSVFSWGYDVSLLREKRSKCEAMMPACSVAKRKRFHKHTFMHILMSDFWFTFVTFWQSCGKTIEQHTTSRCISW